jgi:hypothetical protein
MKIITKPYIKTLLQSLSMILVLLVLSVPVFAQEDETTAEEPKKKVEKPARDAFESAWWFDGQTGKVYNKGTLEMIMNHRFGTIKSGNNDLLGIYGAANIRLGFNYSPIDKLNVGFGYTKNKKILDLTAKYAILTQTRSNSMPVSLTYYGNMGIELQDKEKYLNNTDRYNYFNQLIVMRRFGSKFSAQIAPSYTHYNAVPWEEQDGTWQHMENDTWGISLGARYKVTPTMIIMLGYDQPLTQHDINQPKPSINIGLEIATSAHAFQIFFTNYNKIQPQENYMFNQHDFTETSDGGVWLIGFNITRLWSF